MFWINRALDKADYDEALRRCRLLLRWRASHRLRLVECNVLVLSSRAAEAERELRNMLAEETDAAARAGICRALGDALTALGRRDEAVSMYQGALQLDSSLTVLRPGLAELELECGNPERAQEMASCEPRTSVSSRGDAVWEQATWARVLARLERFAEAMAMVDRATRAAMRLKSKPAQAGAYWRIGQAHLALKNDGQAMVAFENARQVDPNGYYGRLAAQAISQAA